MFYYLLFLSMFIRAQQYFLFLILLSGLSVSLFVSWLLHIHYCDFFRSPMLLCTLIIWRHLGHILSVPFFSPSTNHLLLFLCAFEWCPRKILFKCVISSCKWEVNFFHILCSSSSASYVLSHSFSLFSSQILLLPSSISRLSFSVASTLRCVCRNLVDLLLSVLSWFLPCRNCRSSTQLEPFYSMDTSRILCVLR